MGYWHVGGTAVLGCAGLAFGQAALVPLVVQGDPIAGIGAVTSIADVAVSDSGSWAVALATDYPNGNSNTLVLRDGVVALREDDAVAGTVTRVSFLGSIGIASGGELGVRIGLRNASDGMDSAILHAGQLVIRAGSPCVAPGLPAGTTYYSFYRSWPVGASSYFSPVTLRTSIGNFIYAAVRVTFDPVTGGRTETVLAKTGDSLPGLPGLVTDVLPGTCQGAMNSEGDVVFTAISGNSAGVYEWTTNGVAALATPNGASPIPGRTWSNLAGGAATIADGNHIAITGVLNGDVATNLLLVRDGAVFHQKGDPLPGLATFTITGFGNNRGMRLASDGHLLWYADWNGPAAANAGLFFENRVLVQKGSVVQTSYGALTVKSFPLADSGFAAYAMSPSGRWVTVRAVLTDGVTDRAAALLIDTNQTCAANCDGSTAPPVLNVADFSCFLQEFAGGLAAANCDGSTAAPVLNIADFSCFLQRFAAGCG